MTDAQSVTATQCSACGQPLTPEGGVCAVCGTPRESPLAPAFQRAQDDYARLKRQLGDGRLSSAEMTRALDRVMVEHDGAYWTIGAQTGRWYRSDGKQWTEATPPAAGATVTTQQRQPPPAMSGRSSGLSLSSLFGLLATGLALLSGVLALRQATIGRAAPAPAAAAPSTAAANATAVPASAAASASATIGARAASTAPATAARTATAASAAGGGGTAPAPQSPAPAVQGASSQAVGRLVVSKRYGAPLRATPSSDAFILATLPCGTALQSLGSSAGWARVAFDGPPRVEGWVGQLRVADGGSAPSVNCAGAVTFRVGDTVATRVQSGCLSLRDAPSRAAVIRRCVDNGTQYAVVNGPIEVEQEDWFQLTSPDLGSGWSLAEFLVPVR